MRFASRVTLLSPGTQVLVGDGLVCKIADFGLSRFVNDDGLYASGSRVRAPTHTHTHTLYQSVQHISVDVGCTVFVSVATSMKVNAYYIDGESMDAVIPNAHLSVCNPTQTTLTERACAACR